MYLKSYFYFYYYNSYRALLRTLRINSSISFIFFFFKYIQIFL